MGKPSNEKGIFTGRPAAEPVIEVSDGKAEIPLLPVFQKEVQQTDRIRSPGHRN